MMWDCPFYAVNMFYYHWLIKKLFWPMAGRIEQGRKTKLNARRKSHGDTMYLPTEKDTRIDW